MLTAILKAGWSDARRRVGSLVVLALVIGLVGAVALGAAAGVRRTATSLDRFLEFTDAQDASAFVYGPDPNDAVRELAAVDGVVDAAGSGYYLVDAGTTYDFGIMASLDGRAMTEIERPLLVQGRFPDVAAADEVALSDSAAAELGLETGDRLHLRTIRPASFARLVSEGGDLVFDGPELDLEVVGIVRTGGELQRDLARATPFALGSPAFHATYSGQIATGGTIVALKLRDAAALDAVTRRAIELGTQYDGGNGGAASSEDDYVGATRSAIRVATGTLVLFLVMASLAGLFAIGTAVGRHAASGQSQLGALSAIGLTRRERAAVLAFPMVLALAAGAVAAVIGAYLTSGRYPVAVARRAEPDPGLHFDPAVLVPVTLAFVAVVALIIGLSSWRRALDERRTSRRTSGAGVFGHIGRLGRNVAPTIGMRHATDPGAGPTAVPIRSAIVATALGVTAAISMTVVLASLDEAVDRPGRWGWTWTSMPDLVDTSDPLATLARVASDPDVEAVGAAFDGPIELDGRLAMAGTMVSVSGSLLPALVSGRLPSNEGEIALGRATMQARGLELDDRVEATVPGTGATTTLRVVGQVASGTAVDGNPANTAYVLPATLQRLAGAEELLDLASMGFTAKMLVRYRPSVDSAVTQQRLETQYGLRFPGYAFPTPPGKLVNLGELRPVFYGLAAFFVVTGLLGLAHALALSVRRRRREFGVLRALGLRRRQGGAVVHWQATAVAVMALTLGIPAGVIVGRLIWQALVGDLGIVVRAATPWAVVGLLSLALLVAASIVAIVPARWVSRARIAQALGPE